MPSSCSSSASTFSSCSTASRPTSTSCTGTGAPGSEGAIDVPRSRSYLCHLPPPTARRRLARVGRGCRGSARSAFTAVAPPLRPASHWDPGCRLFPTLRARCLLSLDPSIPSHRPLCSCLLPLLPTPRKSSANHWTIYWIPRNGIGQRGVEAFSQQASFTEELLDPNPPSRAREDSRSCGPPAAGPRPGPWKHPRGAAFPTGRRPGTPILDSEAAI